MKSPLPWPSTPSQRPGRPPRRTGSTPPLRPEKKGARSQTGCGRPVFLPSFLIGVPPKRNNIEHFPHPGRAQSASPITQKTANKKRERSPPFVRALPFKKRKRPPGRRRKEGQIFKSMAILSPLSPYLQMASCLSASGRMKKNSISRFKSCLTLFPICAMLNLLRSPI